MTFTRWTVGIGLVGIVSLWGLMEARASPFAMYTLSDDLSNLVQGTAPEASEWDIDGDIDDGGGDSGDGESGGSDSGGGDSGGGDSGVGDSGNGNGNGNNGHGNNADGVDSSNPSNGHGGPNGEADASCLEGSDCVDDEIGSGSSESSGNSGNSGKKKNK